MKRFLLLLVIMGSWFPGFTQTEYSAFNLTGSGYSTTAATDYQCLGINPANLGWTWNDRSMNLGLMESALSVYAEPLTRPQVVRDLFDNNLELTMVEKQEAAMEFVNKRIASSIAITWLGFSYQNDKIGGFAFSIREKIHWNSLLNQKGADFLFIGYNDPYFDSIVPQTNGDTIGYSTDPGKASIIYEGTYQNFFWAREYNLGYGRIIMDKKNFKWYGGISFKYQTIYAGTQYYDATGEGVVGFSALSPLFEVEYDEPTPSQISGSGLKKVGWGWGIDIGTTIMLYDKVKIGIALNDIGQTKYTGNVYEGNDTRVWKIETGGLDNYNIFRQGQLISADNPAGDPEMWQGLNSKTYKNSMNLRAGASYRIIGQAEIGVDFAVPVTTDVPGAYEKLIFGFGGKYDPAKWVQLSLGVVSGGKYGTNMPFGVTFYPIRKETTWQIGLATRDIITLFNSKNPTVSFAMGFLRFSFGNKKAA